MHIIQANQIFVFMQVKSYEYAKCKKFIIIIIINFAL